MNLIKQIVKDGDYGSQTIKMIVKDNERGPQGEKGDPGETATITAGQAYSVPTTSSPSVINTGTSANAVFDFYIPKGETGATGAQGPRGEKGIQGPQGPKGDTGSEGPQGPRGLQGPKGDAGPQGIQGPVGPEGPQGERGISATITVGSTTTLPSGSSATVTNVGSSSAARFNFGIPKGDKGDTGDTGPAGRDGAIQYTAGTGIEITEGNVIQATGAAVATWGGIDGTLSDQTDLKDALDAKQNTLTAGDGITISSDTISADIVPDDYFTANATTNGSGSTLTLNKTIETKLDGVELLGDTYQQTYTGTNLLNINAGRTDQNTTDVVSGDTITVTTASSSGTAATKIEFSYEANRQVTISLDATALQYDASTDSVVTLRTIGSSDTLELFTLDKTVNKTVHYTATTTPNSNTRALWLYLKNTNASGVVSYRFDNVQIEYGSTETSYEPYVGGIGAPNPSYPQSIQVASGEQAVKIIGKNILPNTGSTKTIGGNVQVTKNDDGSYTVNGTATSNGNLIVGSIDFRSGQAYTISGVNGGSSTTLQLYTVSSTAFPAGNRLNSTDGPSTATALADETCSVRIYVYSGTAYNNAIIYPQVELGSSYTSYEPYQEQDFELDLTGSYELCKVGNYQDRIYWDGDDWYVHKAVGETVLNGSENWQTATTRDNVMYYYANPIFPTSGGAYVKVPSYSDYFIPTTYSEALEQGSTVDNCFFFHDTNHYIAFKDGAISSLTDWKTWLTSNHMTVYYPLATPTDTQITDSTLVAQLEALRNAKSYLDQTNFLTTATGTNLPVILDIVAYRSSLAATNDLLATIPEAQVQADWTEADNTAVDYIKNKPTLATVATTGAYSDLTGTPSLATVATSGSYNDLSNKPTIPTVNNATLTIQKNGSTVKTFTANASSNVTANITVPTKTSDLSNDSNFIASTALATVATSGSYADLSNKPTIPTITMTSTDPGEGVPLAANNFIAVYEA